MISLKTMWWNLRSEGKNLVLWILLVIPLRFGTWMRARLLPCFLQHLGANTTLQAGLRITNPERISIGSNCNFGQGVFLTGAGGIRVGDWVAIGPDTKIWSVNHRFEDPDTPVLQQGWEAKEVVVEDDVWLGANVFVMPGTIIGKGAIVSAGSIVTKSIPSHAVVAGNPARVIGWRKRPEAASHAVLRSISASD